MQVAVIGNQNSRGWVGQGASRRWQMPDFPGRVLRMCLDGNDEKGVNQKGISGLREGPNPQNKPAGMTGDL